MFSLKGKLVHQRCNFIKHSSKEFFQAVMKWRNDEVEEALQQLEESDELKEENQRLNNTIKKLKTKQGDKDTNIEVN